MSVIRAIVENKAAFGLLSGVSIIYCRGTAE